MIAVTISILWSLYIIVLIGWIIASKRSPVAALGWILALSALPYIGFLVFYFVGPQKIKRKRIERQRVREVLSWEKRMTTRVPALPPENITRIVRIGMATTEYLPGTCVNVDMLVDGEQTFEAIFAAIRAARRHVHLEYYIFEPDNIGTALRDLLVEKARAGVDVRLLVDALGSKRLGKAFLAPLVEAGARIGFFHRASLAHIRPVINMRTHRKIVVCDDWVGFTGGVNITDTEDERVDANAYHDVHLRLYGDAVVSLQQIFWEDWLYATGEEPTQDAEPQYADAPPTGTHFVQILGSGPDSEWAPIHRAYLAAISAAQDRIWLTTPYFVPDESALMALTNAALHGIDVRIMVPKKSDSWLVTLAARSYFDELTQAGVTVYEFCERMLHSKTMLVDDNLSVIGTANFDRRSFYLNFEVCAGVYGEPLAAALEKQFEEDMLASEPVLKKRDVSKMAYWGEAAARLLSPLL